MGLAGTLAEVVFNLNYENLSEEVVSNAKLHILDGFGVGLHGSTLRPLFDPLIKILKEWGGNGTASVFGEKLGFPARYAAFLNSIIITASAYQETHRASIGHPYSPVMSAGLAVGEEMAAKGKDFIAAVVVGYEVFVRIAAAVNPSLLSRGIQTTGAIGPFGAAVAYGKLIGLNKDQMKDAIAHAANLGGGALIEAHCARPYFAIQVGTNVEKGILAALLAKEGVVGCDTNLEGGSVNEKGFLQAYSDEYDVNIITEGLGERLGIQDTGFSFYLVASFSRTPIDATLTLIQENGIGVKDIKSIRVKLTKTLYNFTQRKVFTAKQSAREAYYYIPFHIALVLLKGGVESEMYTDENLNDPEIRRLMEKVEFIEDPKLDEEFAKTQAVTTVIVELTTNDGNTYIKKLSHWKGDPENPATKEEVEDKFRRLASRVIKPREVEKLMDLIDNLETVNNIQSLGELIRGPR